MNKFVEFLADRRLKQQKYEKEQLSKAHNERGEDSADADALRQPRPHPERLRGHRSRRERRRTHLGYARRAARRAKPWRDCRRLGRVTKRH